MRADSLIADPRQFLSYFIIIKPWVGKEINSADGEVKS